MRTNVKRRAAAAVAVALALGASGCSATAGSGAVEVQAGSFGGEGAAQRLGQAAQATTEVRTLQVAATASISGFSGRTDLQVSVEGALDLVEEQARLAVDAGDVGTVDAVLDGGAAYVRSEALAGLLGEGASWLKVDVASLAEGHLGAAPGPQQLDPTAFLDLLEGVGGPVEEVGTEDVRGVSTTHVKAEVTLAKALAELPAERRARLESLVDGLGIPVADVPPVPVEAWVDADGLVRKVGISIDLGAGKATADRGLGDLVIDASVELFAFGEPVEVTVPPASEVTVLDPATFDPGALGLGD